MQPAGPGEKPNGDSGQRASGSLEFVQVGSDISPLVLNQALAGQPDSPLLLSANRRNRSVIPLGARREDFGSGDDDESLPQRTSSVGQSVERLKRSLQRLTVDRNNLHEFDSPERSSGSGPCVCVNVP